MKRILFLFLFLLHGRHASGQDVYSLEAAQQDALTRSHDISIAALSVAEIKEGNAITRAQRLPRVDLNAGYTHISETGGIDIALPGLPPRSIRFGDGHIWETGLIASVPLFTGFRLSALQDITAQQVTAAEEALDGTRTAVRHQVALVYRRAQLAQRATAIYDEQLRYLHQQLVTLRALLEAGQVLPYDTLLLSTRMSALRVEQRSTETAYENALAELRRITRTERRSFSVSNDILPAAEPLRTRDVASLLELAEQHRSDLRILARQKQMVQLRTKVEQASMLPAVSAFASYRYGRPGVDQVANTWMNYYTAGVSLQWNLWNWGGDRAKVQQQQWGLAKIDEQEARLREEIRTAIVTILRELSVLDDTRRMLEDQIRQEIAKRDLVQARFAEGIATATEVVDAETALTTARLRREQAEILFAMKQTELAAAIGWNE
ncbi:MAG: TolC family protein [Bacteroidetes bacterium]|nr:TolC family protein [Bacteroidota bacterium]